MVITCLCPGIYKIQFAIDGHGSRIDTGNRPIVCCKINLPLTRCHVARLNRSTVFGSHRNGFQNLALTVHDDNFGRTAHRHVYFRTIHTKVLPQVAKPFAIGSRIKVFAQLSGLKIQILDTGIVSTPISGIQHISSQSDHGGRNRSAVTSIGTASISTSLFSRLSTISNRVIILATSGKTP